MNTLNDIAEKIAAVRARRAEVGREEARLAATQKELEAELIDLLTAQGVDRITTGGVNYKLDATPRPAVRDWEALYRAVADKGWFFLLHKRLTATAAAELIAAGETIPGVEVESVPSIRYSKA